MKAMILAAGLGTRLRPLTNHLPKPLIPILGVPLLRWILIQLEHSKVTEVILNCHHLAALLKNTAQRWCPDDILLHFSDEPDLLGTGGGIARTRSFWTGETTMLVVNGDVLHNWNLREFYQRHSCTDNQVSLLVHQREPRTLHTNREGFFLGWRRYSLASPEKTWGYTCIQCISTELLSYMPAGAFNLLPFYLEMARRGARIQALPVDEGPWWDIGTWSRYIQANLDLERMPTLLPESFWGLVVDEGFQFSREDRTLKIGGVDYSDAAFGRYGDF